MNAREERINAMVKASLSSRRSTAVTMQAEDLHRHYMNAALDALESLAPVPSGEVETPCATCGGTREIPALSKQGRSVGVQFCPDCRVETLALLERTPPSTGNEEHNGDG